MFLLCVSFSSQGQQQPDTGVSLRYCINPEWMPFEAIRNGEHIGISSDYLELLSELSNIQFEFVPTQSWTETLEILQSGACDAIPMIRPSLKKQDFLLYTAPFFESPNVLVSRSDDDVIPGYSAIDDRVLGIEKDKRHVEYIARYYRNIETYYVDSEIQGLTLLSEGKIDVFLASQLSAAMIIKSEKLENLVISGFAEPHDSMAMGISPSANELLPIINEAIAAIPESKTVEVYRRWYQVNSVTHHHSIWLVFTGAIFIFAVLTVIWIKRAQLNVNNELQKRDAELEALQAALVEKNRTVEFLTTHDDLTTLHNRNYMVQKVDEEMSRFRRFQSQVTLLLVGVDNLTRGSQDAVKASSDQILQRLADITLQKIREVDIAARWTNEQILILCPQTSALSAQILAERILTEVELQSLQLFEGVKVSIGGASMQEGDSFVDWFDRAHHAMRNAKRRSTHAYEPAQS
ncbi:diguanylate cyclase [Alteromonas sediminis]|uniref:diguanylate cyclase n=1 Tax=Alteromonas sediminis TaxID=2259342 RepID=A0A3N5Y3C1_9ALTE|nr:transporter substrate-binding domain-containing protein [Alteromonas sediminis]RPJ67276.1 diguanylate cyclase [Alteromonas sediminis]